MKAILLTILSALRANAFAADHWPQFRGPQAASFSTNGNLPDKWSATENVAWKADLPGRSWSSPWAAGGRILCLNEPCCANSLLRSLPEVDADKVRSQARRADHAPR